MQIRLNPFLNLNLNMNKILVTGGAGFIGSNLCEALSKDPNNEVYSFSSWDKAGSPFKINLREYYFPIDYFINNPQVYIFENEDNKIVDVIKCESFVQKGGDTLFVSTFYNDPNSPGIEWREVCSSRGIMNIDSPGSKMINSPLFNYYQGLGEKSEASYRNGDQRIFWERIFVDTLKNMVIYEDVFKENDKVVYSRTLFYEYGVGRVAVNDKYGRKTLREVVDLNTFEQRLRE